MWKVNLSESSRRKYRCYSLTAVTSAYLLVKQHKYPIRKAAREFGVPESTVRDRLAGRIDPEVRRSGPDTLFTQEEEAKLAQHLRFMSSVGYGYSRSEVIDIASEFACSLGYRDVNHPLSLHWFSNFMARWPELKVIKPRGLQLQRAKATSAEAVSCYFKELEQILDKYSLKDSPEKLYNIDEKGISTTHKPPHVVTAVSTKPLSIQSATRTNVTVIGGGIALGYQIPPLFFPGASMRSELLEGKSIGASGTVTESGWSNAQVFQEYLENHFIHYLPERSSEQPVLLFYDGHRSYISLGLTGE